jgi:hypothetical protein
MNFMCAGAGRLKRIGITAPVAVKGVGTIIAAGT